MAQSNDYESFKKALIDEIGARNFMKIKSIVECNSNRTPKTTRIRHLMGMRILAKKLIDIAAKKWGLDSDTIRTINESSKREYVYVRTAICMVLLGLFDVKLTDIGNDVFNGKGHLFVSVARDRHVRLIGYPDYMQYYDTLKNNI